MKIIQETLDNGLTVILAPMTGMKTVTGMFGVRAGWKYEDSANEGVAHFLEHMSFKGTRKRPTTFDIGKEVEGRGGQWNASTGEEMTSYYIKMPVKHSKVVCDIISDMLLNSLLEPEEIQKEKGTIIQELRMYLDTPQYYVGMFGWPKILYGDQPAGKCGVGTEESIRMMDRAHFTDFLDDLYVAGNSVFCLTGCIPNPHRSLIAIDRYFRHLEPGKPKIIKPKTKEIQEKPELFFEPRDIQQSHLMLGVRSYPACHPKEEAFRVLKNILGGGMISRMFTQVREKRGLAYYIRCSIDMQTDVGSFCTSAGVAREKVLEAVKVILDEYIKIREEKVPEEELERVKDYIIGSSQMAVESSSYVANSLVDQWAVEGKVTPLQAVIKKIKSVTAEDVQAVAREIFVNKGLNLAIVGPHHGMEEEFSKILHF